jgi:sugar/nucleoside kinase (ribokinase family)
MSPHVLAVGDNVVDCYPDLGVMFPGGNAVNVAVHARRAGADSAYLGAVGTDAAGGLVRNGLVTEDVDTSLTRTVEGPNAYAIVRVVEGNRVFEVADAGVSKFRVTDADLERVAAADVVHTGECSMVEADLPRLAQAARLLSFDFSERPWEYVEEHAPLVSVAVLSATSVDEDPVVLARRVAALGPRMVAVTQGPGGATLLADGRVYRAPAGSGPIVDTLGAGDAFIARLLVGLARAEEPEALLPAATSYATASCAEHGAFGHQAQLPPAYLPASDVSATNMAATS